MSQRGLLLALQRFHDDPGFIDLVNQDTQSTLGIYDLDENECALLTEAARTHDEAALREMAQAAGIDWQSDHLSGVGALDESEVSTEALAKKRGPDVPNTLAGDGYEGSMPHTPS